ncbi:MAG: sigma-54-dependent Fis family transcriptional regulator [Myxococcales bacterium]|nr:MAG: sigma-54-dependent Fis family transcriptional regulator [Myxococcales bacterium]
MSSLNSSNMAKTAMDRLREQLSRLAQSPGTPVLLVGPPGSGKQHSAELLHRQTHPQSPEAPLVCVDCSALTRDFDRELLGEEGGRRGWVEAANGGTLLLREITALPLGAQALLLKFLDGMRLRRIGSGREVELSLRVVATSSREPLELIKTEQFHESLYRRLAVFRLELPPLAARKEEILPLAERFIAELAARSGKRVTGLSEPAATALSRYPFPGNVRELRAVLERALVSAEDSQLSLRDLDLERSGFRASPQTLRFFEVETPDDGIPPALEVIEKAYVHRVLEHTGGRRMAAAQLLGISYPTFLKRLRELGVDDGHSGPRTMRVASAARR